MKTIVTFSGGKDSMAALLWVRNNLTKDFITVFADTGWESEITYQYIHEVSQKLDLNLVKIKSTEVDGFVDMTIKKKRFPSSQARFCTEILKIKPTIDFILDEVNEDVLIVQGIRADESHSRSLMSKQCTFFKYYFQPYGKNKEGKPKFHTYRKKEVLNFRRNHSDDILRPVFDWKAQEVMDYILENGFDPNPLYSKGMKRVGCFPCVMSTQQDIKSIMNFFPERIQELKDIEEYAGSSFFPPDKIPKWACSNREFPSIADVEKYIKAKNLTGSLFPEEEQTSCMSFYGLCE